MIEHKSLHSPKMIHLPCILDVAGHLFFRGETRELSEHEATVQIPALAFPGMQKPQHGANCMLTLNLRGSGVSPPKILKIPCRVAYIVTIVLGLNLNTENMDEHQHKIYDALLKANE